MTRGSSIIKTTEGVKPIHQKPGINHHHSNHIQETPLVKP